MALCGAIHAVAESSAPPADAATSEWTIAVERLAIPNDVPAQLVSTLTQDGSGFLWIGTQGGLVRYDGYGFRVFPSDPNDPTTLAGSYVRALLPARDGRLWVGTFSGGLSVYDPRSETFTRYRHDPVDAGSLAYDRVEGLAEDAGGAIWVATGAGLDRLDPSTGRFRHFRHAPGDPLSLPDDRVRGLLVDRVGRLWAGTRAGLARLSADGAGFEPVASEPGVAGSLAGQSVERLFEDHRGRLWIGTAEHGAAVLEPASGALHRLPPDELGHFWVYGFAEPPLDGPRIDEVWVATFGAGVAVVDGKSLAVRARLRHDPMQASTIVSDRVGAVFADRSGVVWVGGWGEGLARHDPSTRAFTAWRASPNRPQGLSHPAVVRALPRADGTIWAGTNGNGIDVLDAHGRRIDALRPDPSTETALADGEVTCLAESSEGVVWVATLDGTLHRLEPGSRRFTRIRPRDGLPGGAIRALAFGRGGTVWAAAAFGLARIDPVGPTSSTASIRAYRRWPDTAGTSSPAIESLALATDGTLWVGSDHGLFHFDPLAETAVRFVRSAAAGPGEEGLPDNWVPDLLMASDGRLWVGTGGGACVIDASQALAVARAVRERAVTEPQKASAATLPCMAVAPKLSRRAAPAQSLIEDLAGQVWIGPGLRVDPRTFEATSFAAADGAVFHHTFIASRARTREGRLLFGSPEGLLVVDPAALVRWDFAPPVVATALAVDGQARPGAAVEEALVLTPGERGFRLDFAALDFTAPERNLYRYRLLGYDERWTEIDATRRSATYTGLAPGRYRLVVEGSNRAGRFSEQGLALAVEALPAFYQRRSFRLLVSLALVGLAYAGYRWRVRRLHQRAIALERQVAARTAELATANQELAAAYRRIEQASLTDPLTGLRNRRYLEQVIGADLEIVARAHEDHRAHADQRAGQPAAEAPGDLIFLLVDLDHFKSVNDTHGHAAGDAVLVAIAGLLRATFRGSDHLVRWGGEEFLVVARFVARTYAGELAEKLRAAVARHSFVLPDGTTLSRTCSIGFATYPFCPRLPRAVSFEQVVELADRALYAAKRSGRDTWVGLAAGAALDEEAAPAALVERSLADPAAGLAQGLLRAEVPPRLAAGGLVTMPSGAADQGPA